MVKINYNLWIGILVTCLIFLVISVTFLERKIEPNLPPLEKELKYFQECAAKNQLELYGKTNSSAYLAQKEELGSYFDAVPFVDCVETIEKCEGIILMPAWKIKDQIYYGSFSKDILIKLLECK
jgi:hypothetical protein